MYNIYGYKYTYGERVEPEEDVEYEVLIILSIYYTNIK